MNRRTKGRLAEAKVTAYFIENGYEVYLPFSDNSKYDVITLKEGCIKRVSIKFTSAQRLSGSWTVEMRQISRRIDYINVEKFDHSQYDLVAVYIGPLDKVVLVDAARVSKRSLVIKNK